MAKNQYGFGSTLSVRHSERYATDRDSNIDNLSHGSVQRDLEGQIDVDSPRTQQVMFRLGLAEEDVTFKFYDYFVIKGHPESTTRLRYVKHLNRTASNIRELKSQRRQFIIKRK